MIEWIWPWIFFLLPVPWLMRWVLPEVGSGKGQALRIPFYQEWLSQAGLQSRNQQSQRWRWWLAIIAWIFLLVATARPQWLGDPVAIPVSGRDLMLAVDLSGSMEFEDFQLKDEYVNRLKAVKAVAGEFIERRQGDRLGLILFGRQAYLQTPLTFDRETVRIMLEESVIGLAGKETAIGDAIGLAVKRLRDRPENSRVLILLTDGANTAGEVGPVQAAELAAETGLKIYTIGVGAEQVRVNSIFGNRVVNPSSDLDEKTLRQIASLTGGDYFRATNTDELADIYHQLDALEPFEADTETLRPTYALSHWPLGMALFCFALLAWQGRSAKPVKRQGKQS